MTQEVDISTKGILVVDDEDAITRSLCRMLRRVGYTMHSALSGQEAIEILCKEKIDMVISDMRMPGMNGYELLSFVKKTYPGIIRVVLSGHADSMLIIQTIADGTARTFLTKPCGNDELRDHVKYLFDLQHRLSSRMIAETLGTIQELPSLPTLYQRLIECVRDGASMDVVAAIISEDPNYATQILRIVNSSFHAAHIGSIKSACIYLGLDAIKNLVLSTELFKAFKGTERENKAVELLWRHSGLTNRLFHFLYARVYGSRVPDEFSCCGLLHDVGLLAMIKYFPDKFVAFEKLLHQADNGSFPMPVDEAERSNGGPVHSETGAYLLDMWNLPYSLVETCLYHHDPMHKTVVNREICALVHIADCYSWQVVEKLPLPAGLDNEVFNLLSFEKDTLTMALIEAVAGIESEDNGEYAV